MITYNIRTLLIVILFYLSRHTNGLSNSHHGRCTMGHTCDLPNCLCRSYDNPGGLNKTNIPQIVLFTFDGQLDERAYRLYQDLFPSSLRNPNGCPVRITLFLQGNNTNYSLAEDLYYRHRVELAVSSLSLHTKDYWRNITYDQLVAEAYGQKLLIHQKAGVPLYDIKGFRSPFLQPSEAMYEMLKSASLGFEYDSSLAIIKRRLGDNVVWPFTLDFGWPEPCAIKPCPRNPLMGLWEFPVYTLIDLDGYDRIHHSEFLPLREKAAFRYLVQNFRTFYRRNRTPFIVNLKPEWLYHNHTFKATQRFITRLMALDHRDIWLLSLNDALEWIKSPRDTPDSTNFTAWKCSQTDINPAPGAPPAPHTVTPPDQVMCLSVNGVLRCHGGNTTSPKTSPTTSTSITTAAATQTTTQSLPHRQPSGIPVFHSKTLIPNSSTETITIKSTNVLFTFKSSNSKALEKKLLWTLTTSLLLIRTVLHWT